MIKRSPKSEGRDRSGKGIAKRSSPRQQLRRPIVARRPIKAGSVNTGPERRADLDGHGAGTVAGAFMPTMPPKAIGGTMRAYSTRF